MPTILLFNFIKTRLLLLPENYTLDNFAQDSCAETVKLSTQSIYLHLAHTYKLKNIYIDSKSYVYRLIWGIELDDWVLYPFNLIVRLVLDVEVATIFSGSAMHWWANMTICTVINIKMAICLLNFRHELTNVIYGFYLRRLHRLWIGDPLSQSFEVFNFCFFSQKLFQ